jgi:choline dehydrogenase-like flavoprotein
VMKNKHTAVGVKYVNLKEPKSGEQRLEADRIIVCAGAYESPKLLLASRSSRWEKGIGNDHNQVGRYLVSHSILRVQGAKPNPDCWIQELDFPTLMSRTYDTPEYQQHGKLFLFKNRKLPHLNFADAMIVGKAKHLIEEELRGERRMELQAFLEEKGKKENFVGLADDKTSKGLPKTTIVYKRTPSEIAAANSRLELLQRVIREMGYDVKEAQVDAPGGHHATGTCRMADSPTDGVTDKNLQVHGTKNLFVCSNAVMPTGSAVNPTLTLTALSLRLGDYLLSLDHKGQEIPPAKIARRKRDL